MCVQICLIFSFISLLLLSIQYWLKMKLAPRRSSAAPFISHHSGEYHYLRATDLARIARGERKNCALSKLWGSRAQPSVVAKAREARQDGEETTRCQDPRRHPSRAASPPPAAPLQSVLSVDAWPRVSEPNRLGDPQTVRGAGALACVGPSA